MITLNMRLTAKPGNEAELESAIRDKWMDEMSRQDGFIKAVLLKPYDAVSAGQVGFAAQQFDWEVISFWETEEHRATWQFSDVHARVILFVNEAILADGGKQAVLFTVEHAWQF